MYCYSDLRDKRNNDGLKRMESNAKGHMNTTRQSKVKIVEAAKKWNATPNHTRVKKSTGRSNVKRQKVKGKCEDNLTEEKQVVFPCTATQVLKPVNESSTTVQLRSTQIDTPAKIKLQLFPIDEQTRLGLEKDGHNPYLELTLGVRKKITSVIKHIVTKWGSSNVAIGEPMLFPFNIRLENIHAAKRWTLGHTSINTGDVYAAMQTPVFRLRYGWFSNTEFGKFKVNSEAIPSEVCVESDGIQQAYGTPSEPVYGESRMIDVYQEKLKNISKKSDCATLGVRNNCAGGPKVEGQTQSILTWDDCFTNLSIGGLLSEASLQGKMNTNRKLSDNKQVTSSSLTPWDDYLTTLSIGGLISEASLQGNNNSSSKKLNTASRSGPLISDSLEAFIAKQNNSVHVDSQSSILDAEETCHAFSFKEIKDEGFNINLFKFPNISELNKQAGVILDRTCQESKNEISPHSQVFSEENSLGLSGIKWNDSLGPFDLGLSTLR